MLILQGKDYLPVAQRLIWFREEHPDWSIETYITQLEGNATLARAVIKDSTGRIVSTSHKYENEKGFRDHIEKAETGSIGRALALIGYGTQFAPDLDEQERIVDSPIQKPNPAPLLRPSIKINPSIRTVPAPIINKSMPFQDPQDPGFLEDIPF